MLLSDYCRWGNNRRVVDLLECHPDLDLTIEEILNNLLDYYKNTKLQGEHDNMEYKVANYQIKKNLQESIDLLDHLSPEINEILAPYITVAEASDNEGDLPDFDHYDIDTFNSDTSADVHVSGNIVDKHYLELIRSFVA